MGRGAGEGSRVAPSRRLHHLAFSKASKTFPLTPTKPHVPALLENSSKGGGGRELIFHGDRVSFWDEEKVRELDGGEGGITV